MPSMENSTIWARPTLLLGLSRLSVGQYGRCLLLAKSLVGSTEFRVLIAQDGDGEQSGVNSTRFTNRQGADRYSAWHLYHT